MSTAKTAASTNRTPGQIEVWVCPICGYWRQERTTGIHVSFKDSGKGERHKLIKAAYIYLGDAA